MEDDSLLRLLAAYATFDAHGVTITERILSVLEDARCAVGVCGLAHSWAEQLREDYYDVIVGSTN